MGSRRPRSRWTTPSTPSRRVTCSTRSSGWCRSAGRARRSATRRRSSSSARTRRSSSRDTGHRRAASGGSGRRSRGAVLTGPLLVSFRACCAARSPTWIPGWSFPGPYDRAVMVRLLTAGESHGKGLVAVIEGLPAGIPVRTDDLATELGRRRKGYGRSGRQRLEGDLVEVLGGVRHGLTLGSPVAVTIANAEWESKYRERMGVEGSPDPREALTAVRPGHADLAGMQKYGFDDARNVLERASARETAARVAAGYLCKSFLAELGVSVLSHVLRIGPAAVTGRRAAAAPGPEDLAAIDRNAVRCADPAAAERMVAAIRAAQRSRDTL